MSKVCEHEWELVKCTCSPDCKRIHKYCLNCGHHEVNDIKSYQDQLVERIEEERVTDNEVVLVEIFGGDREHLEESKKAWNKCLDIVIAIIKEGK